MRTRLWCAGRLANNTYDDQISGVHIEVRVFESLLRKRMPALFRHLESVDVSLLAIIPQWFLSLFTQACPIEVWRYNSSFATLALLPPRRLCAAAVRPSRVHVLKTTSRL